MIYRVIVVVQGRAPTTQNDDNFTRLAFARGLGFFSP